MQALSEAKDRIEAQEALRLATIVGVGTGSIEQKEAQRIVGAWQRQARGAPAVQRTTPEQKQAMLAAMGIRVKPVAPAADG